MPKKNKKIDTLLPADFKPDYSLLPVRALRYAVAILTQQAPIQGREKWRLARPEDHYAALERHLVAWRLGEMQDEPHLTHALCRMLFLVETCLDRIENDQVE